MCENSASTDDDTPQQCEAPTVTKSLHQCSLLKKTSNNQVGLQGNSKLPGDPQPVPLRTKLASGVRPELKATALQI